MNGKERRLFDGISGDAESNGYSLFHDSGWVYRSEMQGCAGECRGHIVKTGKYRFCSCSGAWHISESFYARTHRGGWAVPACRICSNDSLHSAGDSTVKCAGKGQIHAEDLLKLSYGIEACIVCNLAMPLGLSTVVIPASYGKDTSTAAGMALLSHLLSCATIPLIFMLFEMLAV